MKSRNMAEDVSLEESVFKTLNRQKRRDILRFIDERHEATFTEIMNSVKVEDSSSLSYYLNALTPLVVQNGGKYRLSELGYDVCNLMSKIATYSASTFIASSLRKESHVVLRPGFGPGSATFFHSSCREAAILDRTILPEH